MGRALELITTTISMILVCASLAAQATAGTVTHAHRTHHKHVRQQRRIHHPRRSDRSRDGRDGRGGGNRALAGHARRPRSMVVVNASPPASSHGESSSAATIASVLASACQNTELLPTPGNLEAVENATLCLIDQERARNDELPLRPNADLERAAVGHSEDMLAEDYFEHVAPDGETPLERVTASGYIPNPQVGYTIGENIAWATMSLATPSAIVAAWIASPDHLANILDGSYRDTAVSVLPAAPAALADGQPGAVYTQEFGVIVD